MRQLVPGFKAKETMTNWSFMFFLNKISVLDVFFLKTLVMPYFNIFWVIGVQQRQITNGKFLLVKLVKQLTKVSGTALNVLLWFKIASSLVGFHPIILSPPTCIWLSRSVTILITPPLKNHNKGQGTFSPSLNQRSHKHTSKQNKYLVLQYIILENPVIIMYISNFKYDH